MRRPVPESFYPPPIAARAWARPSRAAVDVGSTVSAWAKQSTADAGVASTGAGTTRDSLVGCVVRVEVQRRFERRARALACPSVAHAAPSRLKARAWLGSSATIRRAAAAASRVRPRGTGPSRGSIARPARGKPLDQRVRERPEPAASPASANTDAEPARRRADCPAQSAAPRCELVARRNRRTDARGRESSMRTGALAGSASASVAASRAPRPACARPTPPATGRRARRRCGRSARRRGRKQSYAAFVRLPPSAPSARASSTTRRWRGERPLHRRRLDGGERAIAAPFSFVIRP